MTQTSITKLYTFEAAHKLLGYNGKCANLHGHSYKLEVTVSGPIEAQGSSSGMVIDFADLSRIVEKEVLSQWDHQFLNDVVSFRTTVENLADEIFVRLEKAGFGITQVRLWETATAYATVTK